MAAPGTAFAVVCEGGDFASVVAGPQEVVEAVEAYQMLVLREMEAQTAAAAAALLCSKELHRRQRKRRVQRIVAFGQHLRPVL